MNVIIPGTWDLFHEGHKKLIDYGAALGRPIIVVNGDELSKLKGKTPTNSEFTRVSNIYNYLEDIEIDADIVVAFDSEETVRVALLHAPCAWLTGRDWDVTKTSIRNCVDVKFWEEEGIYLVYKDRVSGISSTELKKNETRNN